MNCCGYHEKDCPDYNEYMLRVAEISQDWYHYVF
jgi:hypothetical protein